MTMKKYKTGYTQGVFDMFHIGHLNLLNAAKEQCEKLIVGVNADALVMDYKQKQPVIPQDCRRLIVANIKAVDDAVIVDTLDKLEVLKHVPYDVIFIGSDWQNSPRWEETIKQLQQIGKDVVFLPYTHNISSTQLRKVADRNVTD